MLYEEVADEERLKEFIKCSIKEYNSNSEFVPVDILLFRDYIEHICRIVRVISQPMGHILLIGIGTVVFYFLFIHPSRINKILSINIILRWVGQIVAC